MSAVAAASWLRSRNAIVQQVSVLHCAGAFSFVRSTGSFSLLWRDSEAKESWLSGVSRSHSSNDSLCHQSSTRPRQRRQRWRMWQHLPSAQPWTEMLCHPRFGLSAGDDQRCLWLPLSPKSVSKAPSRLITCRQCLRHSPKLTFCRVWGIAVVTFKESNSQGQAELHCRASSCKLKPASNWRKEDSIHALWRIAITLHFYPWAKVRCGNYMWIITFCAVGGAGPWYTLSQDTVTANAFAGKSSWDDVWRCANTFGFLMRFIKGASFILVKWLNQHSVIYLPATTPVDSDIPPVPMSCHPVMVPF